MYEEMDRDQLKANFHLIAAAPDTLKQRNELLEALEKIIAECEGEQMAYRVHGIAATAIANARGEA